MRNLEKKQDDQLVFIQKLIENTKDDNKVLFEKLKLMVNNNSNQLDLVSQEQAKKDQYFSDLENKNSLIAESLSENHKKLKKLEDFITLKSHEDNTKLNELKSIFATFNNNFKPEIQTSLVSFKELISKLEDQGGFLKEKIELLSTQMKKLFQETEKNKLEAKVFKNFSSVLFYFIGKHSRNS